MLNQFRGRIAKYLTCLFFGASTGFLALSQELIVNGSFEDISNTFINSGDGFESLPVDSTVIPG